MKATELTNFMHSRNFALLMVPVSVGATIAAYLCGEVIPVTGNRGIAIASPNLWMSWGCWSMALSLALICGIAAAAIFINKSFNIMRSMTSLWASLFLVITAALPSAEGQFYGGTMLCAVIVGATALMFSCYGDKSLTRRVFLIFMILTVASLYQYAMLPYLVVMFPALAQMRVFNLRSVIAAILGIITPLWIAYGCGILSLADLRLPEFVSTLSALQTPEMIVTFATIGLTTLLALTALTANLMKSISYTAKFRAYNGFMSLMTIVTILLLFIDYNNLIIYIPLLNFLTAYQLAHFFSNNRSRRSFVAILSIMGVYGLAYAAVYLI